MDITPGRYRTRCARVAVVLHILKGKVNLYPAIGFIDCGDSEHAQSWTRAGSIYDGQRYADDLVERLEEGC